MDSIQRNIRWLDSALQKRAELYVWLKVKLSRDSLRERAHASLKKTGAALKHFPRKLWAFLTQGKPAIAPLPKTKQQQHKEYRLDRANRVYGDRKHVEKIAYGTAVMALASKLGKRSEEPLEFHLKLFKQHFAEVDLPNMDELFLEAAHDEVRFPHYAHRIFNYFSQDKPVLKSLVRRLFDFAAADGPLTKEEMLFLQDVTYIFGLSANTYTKQLTAILLPEGSDHAVLGLSRGARKAEIKKAYRDAVQLYHPDYMIGQGLGATYQELSNRRMARLKEAYDALVK
jgi:DnaJ like chaperone protein